MAVGGDALGMPFCCAIPAKHNPTQTLDCSAGLGILSFMGAKSWSKRLCTPLPQTDMLCAALFLSIATPPHAPRNPQIFLGDRPG